MRASSSPRRRGSRFLALLWIPAFAGMTAWTAPLQGTPEEIVAAIEAAVKKNDRSKEFLSQLARQLRNPDTAVQVKERAAWALGMLEARSQVPALLEAAQSKGLLVRSAALNSLMRLRALAALPVFIQIAQSDPVLSMRQRAVIGLGLLRTDKAIKPLVDLSVDEKIEVRGAAALAMAAHHSPRNDFTQALKEMTSDESSYVAERAQVGLDFIQRKNQRMRLSLESDDSDIRLFTALYFQGHGGGVDLKVLRDAANVEADDDVRHQMAQALTAIKKRVDLAKKKEKERQEQAQQNRAP